MGRTIDAEPNPHLEASDGMYATHVADGQRPSTTIIEAVAEVEGVAPTDVDGRLYDVVDPDALDRLFERTHSAVRTAGCVTFPAFGYLVMVFGNGDVIIHDVDVQSECNDN